MEEKKKSMSYSIIELKDKNREQHDQKEIGNQSSTTSDIKDLWKYYKRVKGYDV